MFRLNVCGDNIGVQAYVTSYRIGTVGAGSFLYVVLLQIY